MSDTSLHQVARPGAILSQLWPDADKHPGESLRGFQAVAEEDFFEAVLASPIADVGERREVAALCTAEGISYTYGMIPLIAAEGLSLGTPDAALRARSIDVIKRRCEHAREAGAIGIMVSPGPAPESEAERQQSLALLADSLRALCEAAPDLRVMIEPLDVAVHKKQALGYTPEAVKLAKAVQSGPGQFALCLDTSHIALNGEDVAAALSEGSPFASTWHFCNAVIDPNKPMYGDNHPPLGGDGFLDLSGMTDLMALGVDIGFFGEQRPEVMIEEFNYAVDDFEAGRAIMREAIESLTTAWQQVNAAG